MFKKLKIQFFKPGRSLAMIILEQKGLPKLKNDGFIRINAAPYIESYKLCLRGNFYSGDDMVTAYNFDNTHDRDLYLKTAIKAISNELFSHNKKLDVGSICEASDNRDFSNFVQGKLLAILPDSLTYKYIISCDSDPKGWTYKRYARSVFNPIIEEECNGLVVTYTWETN